MLYIGVSTDLTRLLCSHLPWTMQHGSTTRFPRGFVNGSSWRWLLAANQTTDILFAPMSGIAYIILDPVLQTNKKIPKSNCCARMSHFVGFSRFYSSDIALLCNFYTGHISPQYHVVFDNKFETISSDG